MRSMLHHAYSYFDFDFAQFAGHWPVHHDGKDAAPEAPAIAYIMLIVRQRILCTSQTSYAFINGLSGWLCCTKGCCGSTCCLQSLFANLAKYVNQYAKSPAIACHSLVCCKTVVVNCDKSSVHRRLGRACRRCALQYLPS